MASGLLDKYKDLVRNLLPKGRVWVTQEQPTFSALLDALAVEFCRVEERVIDLLRESDVREANELLDRWETLLGLPDECSPTGQTLDERRDQALQKLTNVGGLSKEFYEFLILQLGFVSTVENRVNFTAGRGRAGDPLNNYWDIHFVAGSKAGEQLDFWGWMFYFNVELPVTSSVHFVAGSVAGTPLVLFSNELIECTIKRLKPAHSAVTFSFV